MFDIPHREFQELLNLFFDLLNEPSERSMIIVAFARLESLADEVLGIVDPGAGDPSFSRAVTRLKSLGQIDEDTFDCCVVLARIRNHYAHRFHDCSLNDAEITDAKKKLFGILDRTLGLRNVTQKFISGLKEKMKATVGFQAMHPGWKSDENELIRFAYMMLWIHLLVVRSQATAPPKPLPLAFHQFKTV
jgi:hypothetical protein